MSITMSMNPFTCATGITPHPSFSPFFEQEQPRLLSSLASIRGEPLPLPLGKVFRFATQDLHSVRVIILGMDPYPQSGVPTGRAFEVSGYDSWLTPVRNASLNNILKLLYRTYHDEYVSIGTIRERIASGLFPILPPCEWFDSLESQGVLFLNVFPTVRLGIPMSHSGVWQWYPSRLVEYISSVNGGITWFMFGRQVQHYSRHIGGSGQVFECDHPSRININKPTSFINSSCFRSTRNIVDWLG